jgi:hypothetical protein
LCGAFVGIRGGFGDGSCVGSADEVEDVIAAEERAAWGDSARAAETEEGIFAAGDGGLIESEPAGGADAGDDGVAVEEEGGWTGLDGDGDLDGGAGDADAWGWEEEFPCVEVACGEPAEFEDGARGGDDETFDASGV